ncbi:epoxide hydrolase family protein [Sphingomonas crocodyli]|uniref:Epoxide hydrolase n=1 Tax=Sphingomonas crocodyli TaxID=1979270 RepID=A0A437M7C5_9SPHN|nr:epoxide hydrolase family protein [Sphingomonas crocodyli]RVT93631.1 epoxide hydrolase [Sphingomonas crocodyli]
MTDATAIRPLTLAIPQTELADLAARLRLVRWPDRETGEGWFQGVPLDEMRALCDHWLHRYDWRRCEAEINRRGSSVTTIDGLDIHFLHVPSPEPGATPLLLTHGWPGSIVEFLKVIDGLSDPVANGGRAEDAFHLVIPSIPGYGFSGKPCEPGWNIERVARAWAVLMDRLGYRDYIAQGGDWGAGITQAMGSQAPAGLAAIHLNLPLGFPTEAEMGALDPVEAAVMADFAIHQKYNRAYSEVQRTKPQSLGYGLADSPVAQAAWIYEKFFLWTDCAGHPTNVFSYDEILDNIMLYWLTNSGASAARMYHESSTNFAALKVDLPVGVSSFPKEIMRSTRAWTERLYPDFIYWNELPRGGHFAAFEQPDLFVDELRRFRRTLSDRG